MSACERARLLLPWSARVYKEVGYVYLLLGQFGAAMESFRAAERLQRSGQVRWTWAVGAALTALLQDRTQEALQWLNLSETREDTDAKLAIVTAVAQRRAGQSAALMPLSAILGRMHPAPTAHELIGNWFPARIAYGQAMRLAIGRLELDVEQLIDSPVVDSGQK